MYSYTSLKILVLFLDKTCGILKVSEVTDNQNNRINLEKCGKKWLNSPWFFEMKGKGNGELSFYTWEFNTFTHAYTEFQRIAVFIQLGTLLMGKPSILICEYHLNEKVAYI